MAKFIKWEQDIFKRADKKITLTDLIYMHYMRCLNRIVHLFDIENLPFPQHEIHVRTIVSGFGGVVKDEKCGIMTAWGGMSGPTQYADYFKKFTYAAPTAKGGTMVIGKDCVIMRNTSLTEGMHTWLMRYAELYAHNDLSLKMALINSRYQDIIKTTAPEKKEMIEEWYKGLYRGEMVAILDDTPLSEFLNSTGDISTLDLTNARDVDFTRFTELENELTRSFYRDIGVRWNKDKKANLVAGEVEQDNMLLQFNVYDMLRCRETFCEEYNKVFSTSKKISVKLAIPIESEVKADENL